jgi:hypothetical protein
MGYNTVPIRYAHKQERPWTERYWQAHPPFGKEVPPIVEPIRAADWKWFRGDRVELLKGPDKGKQVISVLLRGIQLTFVQRFQQLYFVIHYCCDNTRKVRQICIGLT